MCVASVVDVHTAIQRLVGSIFEERLLDERIGETTDDTYACNTCVPYVCCASVYVHVCDAHV